VKKVCFIASTGGHFEQLMMLKPLMNKYESFIVTEKTDYSVAKNSKKIYYLNQVNRNEKTFIFKMILNSFNTFRIFMKEKPDVIISTGALATIPMCLLAKIFKRKLIFIESFAKVNSATLTGKLLSKFADQFYVQWKDMLRVYPNAIYKGGIY
jgi:beta-1,4-N-acetylglucosaminyltransferase